MPVSTRGISFISVATSICSPARSTASTIIVTPPGRPTQADADRFFNHLRGNLKGRAVFVRVLPKGFEFEGEVYRSLSAIAAKVTGSHWNGFRFFGLHEPGITEGKV